MNICTCMRKQCIILMGINKLSLLRINCFKSNVSPASAEINSLLNAASLINLTEIETETNRLSKRTKKNSAVSYKI
jgi:hypothetical protein